MSNTLLSRAYLGVVTTYVVLTMFCIADAKVGSGQMFPYPNPNAWTWSLWTSLALTAAPWLVVAYVWMIEHTVGIPTKTRIKQPAVPAVETPVLSMRDYLARNGTRRDTSDDCIRVSQRQPKVKN